MKVSPLVIGAAGLLILFADRAAGEDVPILTLRAASVERLRTNAAYLAHRAGHEDFGSLLRMLEVGSGNLKGLAELDQGRPLAGVWFLPTERQPLTSLPRKFVAIVPVKNVQPKGAIEIELSTNGGLKVAPRAEKLGDNLYRWRRPDEREILVRLEGDVALLGEDRALIETLRPAAPGLCDAGRDEADLEVRWDHARIPQTWRILAAEIVDKTQESIEGAGNKFGPTERFIIATAHWLLAGCESMALTWNLLSESNQVELRFTLEAAEGSDLDDSMRFLSRTPNRFRGLSRPDANLNALVSLRLSPDMQELLRFMQPRFDLQSMRALKRRSDLDRGLLASLDQLEAATNDAIQALIASGRIEGGLSVFGDADNSELQFGMYFPGADTLRSVATDVVRKGAAYSDDFRPDVGRIGEFPAHQVLPGGVLCLRSDDILGTSGNRSAALMAGVGEILDRANPASEASAIVIEGDMEFMIGIAANLWGASGRSVNLRSGENPGGRVRFQVDRADRKTTASLVLNAAAVQQLLPFLAVAVQKPK
jgi:hypothetical protein